jgi:DNA-binding PadR family transcriptional regulator
VLRVAFERLLDQLDPRADAEDVGRRAARRLCGRWLMVRRLARGLTYSMVAGRTGIGEQALELLELGLLEREALAEELWQRLALVLEAPANDYAYVVQVLSLAAGQAAAFDLAFLQDLERQLPAPEEVTAAQPRTVVVTVPAGDLPTEVRGILEALLEVGNAPLTSYELKRWLEQHYRLSLSPVALPRKLEALARDGLINSVTTDALGSFTLTAEGRTVLALDRRRRGAREAQIQLEQAYLAHTRSKPSLSSS